MTDVEITSKADDHLAALDPQARERVLKKLAEAREWTEHRLERLSDYPYHKLRAGDYRAIISGTGRTTSSTSRRSATAGTSTTGTCRPELSIAKKGALPRD